MKTPTLSLADVTGDYLNLKQYCAWRGLSAHQVRYQVKRGICYVTPCEEKPHLMWRKFDCQRRMINADIIRERQARAKSQLAASEHSARRR